MPLIPVAIDAATIFDPARLIAVLAAVDIRYSEIWVPLKYDHFKEKDYLTGFGTDSAFGLLADSQGNYKVEPLATPSDTEVLKPSDWSTGPKILRWALEKGRAVPKDLSQYKGLTVQLQQKDKLNSLSEAVLLGPPSEGLYDARAGKGSAATIIAEQKRDDLGPAYAWRLEPYGMGGGIAEILAAGLEGIAEPFLSHPYFFDGRTTHNYNFYTKDESIKLLSRSENHQMDHDSITIEGSLYAASNLLRSPEPVAIADVAFFLEHKERIQSIQGLVSASKALGNRSKDCGIIASKFLATTVADAALFGGVPVSTTLVSVYDIAARWLKRE